MNLAVNRTNWIGHTAIYLAILLIVWLTTQHSIGNPDFKTGLWNPEKAVADLGKWVGQWATSWMQEGVLKKTIAYFIYEMVKLPIILGVTTFFLSIIRLSIPRQWLDKAIHQEDLSAQGKGVLLGILTPVCSCVISPIYAGLIVNGGSTKATAAFLFSAPSMNVFAIAVMAYIGGLPLLGIYLATGFAGAILTAALATRIGISREKLNSNIIGSIFCKKSNNVIIQAAYETWSLVKKLYLALIITGAFAAVLFHFNAVPVELVKSVAYSWYAPLVAISGLPLDINAASSLPLVAAVLDHIGLGTLVAFMLAMTLTSIPQIFVMGKLFNYATVARLIAWYGGYAVASGLLINLLFTSVE